MTPEAAIYQFLSSFGMPAYTASSVPDQDSPEWQGFPYMTYEPVQPDYFAQANMPVNIWYKGDSERPLNAKVREIGEVIPPRAKVPFACDGGGILISRGSPWAQGVTIPEESVDIKRRLLNITIEYAVS